MRVSAHKCRNILHSFPVIAWLIMILQKMLPWDEKSFSHMALSFDDGNTVRFFESGFFGVKKVSQGDFLKKYKIIKTYVFTQDETEVEFINWFDQHKGKKYDYFQLFGLLLKSIGFTKFNKIGHNSNRLVCNELVLLYASQRYNIDICDSDNYDMLDTWKIITGL